MNHHHKNHSHKKTLDYLFHSFPSTFHYSWCEYFNKLLHPQYKMHTMSKPLLTFQVDEDLAAMTACRLSLDTQATKVQPGVPGFPDFPACWMGEEGNRVVENDDEEEEERERQLILAEARALKEAAQRVRHRRSLKRRAVNKFGIGTTYKEKAKAHKRGSVNARYRTRKMRGNRQEIEQLRQGMKAMRITVKIKLE